jgi:hypothetical protein
VTPNPADEPRLARLPSFQAGGYVQKTGIALVHQGEYILPAAGSEAQVADNGPAGSGQTVHYYFPIEVEVVGHLSQAQLARIAAFVSEEITDALPK